MANEFPKDFLWGASTASYQIEGAANEDGRGPSIWDTFGRIPGKVLNGDTGDVACDHYHRYPQDVALMRELGLGAYRLSTAWSRILPSGAGKVNAKGLEFYDRVVDAVLAAGIEPWICLYHWDLPQALEDRGGWQNRDCAGWFSDYAGITARRLGDRVKTWATFNEPNVSVVKGYCEGEHAPGIRGRDTALRAMHTINLAHGLGTQALRNEWNDLSLGNIYNFHPRTPATDRPEDREAAAMQDALSNRSFPDPQILGRYPEPIAREMEKLTHPGDFDIIRQKQDYFAFNHYTASETRWDRDHPFHFARVEPHASVPVTEMGWAIAPKAFLDLMIDVQRRYSRDLPMYITENGAAFPERVEGGKVRDPQRVAYLKAYIGAVADAIAAGVPVRGYFVWSLLDNFEWALGYGKRFGIVYVDYQTQERLPKDSFRFYGELAKGAPLDRD